VTGGAYLSFGGALLLGAYLSWVGGWPIVLVGCASLLAGIAYTGGVRPIAYSALGELFVFLFFGLAAVVGSYYLQTGTVSGAALACGSALGLLAAAVLLVNNYRDLEGDRRAGKRTLAVRAGRRAVRRLYPTLLLLPLPLALLVAPWPLALVSWLALPLAWGLTRRFLSEPPGPAFNTILAATARLQALYALLLCAALLASRW
jgi:1,4-dihydroxy-2-naphthoate octaprenyltransferase